MLKKSPHLALVGMLLLTVVVTALARNSKRQAVKTLSAMKFEQDDEVKCLTSALETGDPVSGASTFILKAPRKCVVPWHYHSAEEHLIVIRGAVLAEMDGIAPALLKSGGFAIMRSKQKHQFSCKSKTECIIVVAFDKRYDVFWVRGSQYLLDSK